MFDVVQTLFGENLFGVQTTYKKRCSFSCALAKRNTAFPPLMSSRGGIRRVELDGLTQLKSRRWNVVHLRRKIAYLDSFMQHGKRICRTNFTLTGKKIFFLGFFLSGNKGAADFLISRPNSLVISVGWRTASNRWMALMNQRRYRLEDLEQAFKRNRARKREKGTFDLVSKPASWTKKPKSRLFSTF